SPCPSGPGTTCTSSQPSSPHWSRICLVAWTISGTVAYSQRVMAPILRTTRRGRRPVTSRLGSGLLLRGRGAEHRPAVGATARPGRRPASADLLGDLVSGHIVQRGPPGLHRWRPAQQRPPFPFGHPAPDSVLDAVVQRVHEALQPYRTLETDLSGLPLRGPLDEQLVRRTLGARSPQGPLLIELGVHAPPLYTERLSCQGPSLATS